MTRDEFIAKMLKLMPGHSPGIVYSVASQVWTACGFGYFDIVEKVQHDTR